MSWLHRRWMERLPHLSSPSFDPEVFDKTCFQIWAQDDVERKGETLFALSTEGARSYRGIGSFLRSHDAKLACLITAWNPDSQPKPLSVNEAANLKLLAELEATGLPIYPARGTSMEEGCDWFEDSFLIVGGRYEQYVEWQKTFGQLAFVIFRTDGAVELCW